MARVVVAKRRNAAALCLVVFGSLATHGLLATLTPSSARAQPQNPQQVVLDLNRQAMEAYNALDINKAGSMLEEALRVGYEGRVPPQLMATTSVNLGVVYIGGLSDQDHGLNYFVQALCTDPSSQLDPLMSSPDIQNVWSVALQRAQGGACTQGAPQPAQPAAPAAPVGPPPPPPPPPPEQALLHLRPAEQLAQTPLPLYVEINPLARARSILVYYKGLGMKEFKSAPMQSYQSGFAYQISCNDVWEPKVQYYIEARSDDDRVVGIVGTLAAPIDVPVVAARTQAEPALPGAQAPTSCASKECPPGLSGCKKVGTAAIGESCGGDGACQSGLSCDDGSCALIGGGGTEVPEYDPETGETESVAADEPGDFRPTFIQLGFTTGFAYVQAGMSADRPSPADRVFIDGMGNFIADPTLSAPGDLHFPEPGSLYASKLTSWVPDADSGDALGPIAGNCSADGTATGPLQVPAPGSVTAPARLPSDYCVRVKKPGFVPTIALRAAIGHFVTPRISIAAILRFQFAAGQGTFGGILLGARGEYLITAPKARGLMLSSFAGLTFGQIQALPPADGDATGAPFVESGPLGVHVGGTVRYRIMPNFGLFAAPEVDVLLPKFMLNIDVTLLGVEAAF